MMPARICLSADTEQLMHGIQMLPEDAAKLWGLIYGHASSKDKLALMRLLKVQAAMRAELRSFVRCREAAVSI